jgi:hypothetical protein
LRQVTRTMRGDFTKKPWYASYVLFILGLVSILNYYDRFLMTVLLEPIKRDLHISDGQIGLLRRDLMILPKAFRGMASTITQCVGILYFAISRAQRCCSRSIRSWPFTPAEG